LVEGGNEERCGGLGYLSGGGGRSRGVVLRLLFSALVIVNEHVWVCTSAINWVLEHVSWAASA
jgi:hypothetical protein